MSWGLAVTCGPQCAISAFRRISSQQTFGPFFLIHFRGQNPQSLSTRLSNQMEPHPFREEGDHGEAGISTRVCAPQARDPSPNDLRSGVWDAKAKEPANQGL